MKVLFFSSAADCMYHFDSLEKCESVQLLVLGRPAGRMSVCSKNFNVAIFSDTIDIINVTLSVMAALPIDSLSFTHSYNFDLDCTSRS